MLGKLICTINTAISLLAVYLAMLYGRLHWWYRDAKRPEAGASNLQVNFFSLADQLAILAIVLAALISVGNFAIWKSKVANSSWSITALAVSALCFILLLFIRF